MQAAARKEAKQKRNANKWIFVTSADGQQLYVAPKVKGNFQHSSFLAGEQQLSGFALSGWSLDWQRMSQPAWLRKCGPCRGTVLCPASCSAQAAA